MDGVPSLDDPLLDALRSLGNSSFRPCQREAVEAALEGRDSLVLLPTGGGKSLCYTLPALVARRCALVVSPLISLMQDQVEGLRAKGVSATYLSPSQTDAESVRAAYRGQMSVVFVTPERAARMTAAQVREMNVGMIAVDEAHCAAEWGHDFRPDYLSLHSLRSLAPRAPVMALTATATPDVQAQIAASLRLRDPYARLVSSFDRPNLSFEVRPKPPGRPASDVLAAELTLLPAIVYAPTTLEVEELASGLAERGFAAAGYHGQMGDAARAEVQSAFVPKNGSSSPPLLDVVVATLAFGMGIDKPNVRTVLHWGPTKSVEAYYQQAGRAGRDGLPSRCALFVARSDWQRMRRIVGGGDEARVAEAQMAAMRRYCDGESTCRRRALLLHFGEDPEWGPRGCGACDACASSSSSSPRSVESDCTHEARAILFAVEATGGVFGLRAPCDLARGALPSKQAWMADRYSSVHGLVRGFSSTRLRAVGEALLSRNLLEEHRRDGPRGSYSAVRLSSSGAHSLLDGSPPILLPLPPPPLPTSSSSSSSSSSRSSSSSSSSSFPTLSSFSFSRDAALLASLKAERKRMADGRPPYVVASDRDLAELVAVRPQSLEELLTVRGFGDARVAKYGAQLVACVSDNNGAVQ